MEELSDTSPGAQRSRMANLVFIGFAVLAFLYIAWRGFVSESGKRPTPLFGETTQLKWQGHERDFVLVRFADFNKAHPGDLLIRAGEPSPTVWQVVSRDSRSVHLETRSGGPSLEETISLPATEETPRYVLLQPARSGH